MTAAATATAKAYKELYDSMHSDERTQFLSRARHNALLTIPSSMPQEGHSRGAHLVEPYQGLGAYAVSNLANRMTTALVPAGRPVMRLDPTPQARLQTNGEIPPDVEKALALTEQLIHSEIEGAGWRETTLEVMEQLIVSGTVCERQFSDNTLEMHSLDHFVCRIGNKGNLVDLVVREELWPNEISRSVLAQETIDELPRNQVGKIELFTRVEYNPTSLQWEESTQTSNGDRVGEQIEYTAESLEWRVYRWDVKSNESYGRAKVEIHAGDLRSLESLEKAGLELAGMASFHFVAIAPGATAPGLRSRIREVRNGGTVVANPDSVDLKSFANTTGYQITSAHVQGLVDRISRGFLLLSGVRRDAERVTAEEIRADIDEIENAVGGVFGNLASKMMDARINLAIRNMLESDPVRLPDFMRNDQVKPKVLTGLEALSRERDAAQAMQGAQVVQAFGETATAVVKLPRLLSRVFTGLGLPDMTRTEEEVAAEQQRQQQAALAQTAVEKAAGPVAQAAVEGEQ